MLRYLLLIQCKDKIKVIIIGYLEKYYRYFFIYFYDVLILMIKII